MQTFSFFEQKKMQGKLHQKLKIAFPHISILQESSKVQFQSWFESFMCQPLWMLSENFIKKSLLSLINWSDSSSTLGAKVEGLPLFQKFNVVPISQLVKSFSNISGRYLSPKCHLGNKFSMKGNMLSLKGNLGNIENSYCKIPKDTPQLARPATVVC